MRKLLFTIVLCFVCSVLFADGNDTEAVLLLHCDGADTSTTFTDESIGGDHGNATVVNDAQVDTAQKVFGTGSLYVDGTDYIYYATDTDWNLGPAGGSNDWVVDFRVRFDTSVTNGGLVSTYDGAGNGWYIMFYSNSIQLWSGSNLVFAWTPSADTWYHVAVVHSSTSTYCFVNGTAIGSTLGDIAMDNDSKALQIGRRDSVDGIYHLGWIDEIRISKGTDRGWTSNFTPPTEAYSAGGGVAVGQLINVITL
uniref:Putative lectin/glucanase superfamily protein n=1 Tax=viral metagenome TaxID=1070528 RepID=A0A6M3J791_9ZZZZ